MGVFAKEECQKNGRVRVLCLCIKGRGECSECANYRVINLLSVVGKVYGRILIDKIRSSVDKAMGEEQHGFRGETVWIRYLRSGSCARNIWE